MPKPTTQVDAIRHPATRKNIPTNELRDFLADYEATPQVMRYPRDPSLDPQLVWRGKDEQDAGDLTVDVAPIYIQEKIHPRAIIADSRVMDPLTSALSGRGTELCPTSMAAVV